MAGMVAGRAIVSHSVILGMDRCGVHALQKFFGTALHWASAGGHVECVRLLLDRGAVVDVVSVSSLLVVRTHRVAWVCRGARRAFVDSCM